MPFFAGKPDLSGFSDKNSRNIQYSLRAMCMFAAIPERPADSRQAALSTDPFPHDRCVNRTASKHRPRPSCAPASDPRTLMDP